ncbi:Uncharacterized protein OBRU01_05239 [Operophtera brumata]|uniref:Uncharacterized protein n=1 Tax=Operophtera brumata TaxID=104452 RepID=A0A0L7LN64_OPEBR|nr:Uncharacterized protein OBRU01_05239 [Operophtera brumata]
MLSEGIAKGIVRPLSRVVYSPVHVSQAFRLQASSKHRGKVLIGMKNPDSLIHETKFGSSIIYSSNGTYIVVCDDIVLGMELADQLVKQGARKLVICMKPNRFTGYCYTKFM